jgi:hypothetical protein
MTLGLTEHEILLSLGQDLGIQLPAEQTTPPDREREILRAIANIIVKNNARLEVQLEERVN